MVEYPDNYTLRRAFYNALPTRISLILGPTHGMSPEKNLFNNLVDAAIEVGDVLVGETLRHIPKGMSMVAGTSGMNNRTENNQPEGQRSKGGNRPPFR